MPAAVAGLRALGVELDGHPFTGIRYVDGVARGGRAVPRRARPGRPAHLPVGCAACAGRRSRESRWSIARPARSPRTSDSVTAGGVTRALPRRRRRSALADPAPARARSAEPAAPAVRPPDALRHRALVRRGRGALVGSRRGVRDARRPGPGRASPCSRPGDCAYQDHLAAFPALRDRLGDAAPQTSVRGAGPLRQRVSSRVAGRVLLVGDAAGYVDAITGEGIALARRRGRSTGPVRRGRRARGVRSRLAPDHPVVPDDHRGPPPRPRTVAPRPGDRARRATAATRVRVPGRCARPSAMRSGGASRRAVMIALGEVVGDREQMIIELAAVVVGPVALGVRPSRP